MKNKLLLTLLIVLSLFLVTGCGKKEETNEKDTAVKAGNKSYTCVTEGEMSDGGKTITKLIVVLDKDNYIVENQIINERYFPIYFYLNLNRNRDINILINIRLQNQDSEPEDDIEIKGYLLDYDIIRRKQNGEYIKFPEAFNGY